MLFFSMILVKKRIKILMIDIDMATEFIILMSTVERMILSIDIIRYDDKWTTTRGNVIFKIDLY
jgi:hypothetical protein